MDNFEKFLVDLGPTNFCIIGDLNARIGSDQVLDSNFLLNITKINEIRLSRDKINNPQGKRLMDVVEELGGIILNGRTKGDYAGEFTFYGGRGSTVIDYCICSESLLSYVDDFSVGCKPYSDHMPLNLNLVVTQQHNQTHSATALQRLRWNNKNALKYYQSLTQLSANITNITFNVSVDDLVISLVNKVKQANSLQKNNFYFVPRQKWFNWKCYRSRNRMSDSLNKYKIVHSNENKLKYMAAKAKYLNTIRQRKLEYYNENLNKLSLTSCSKEWWKLANEIKVRKTSVYSNLSADDFKEHFISILRKIDEVNTLQWCIPLYTDPFLDSPFEMCELMSVLKSLKSDKAPGQDGITYEFFKYAPFTFIKEMFFVLNTIFLREEIPSSFKKSILIPLFKKGDPNCPANYRGLSLIDTMFKIFNNIILNRITDWINKYNILNEYQAGFRKSYSTIDNVFNLVNLVHLNKLSGKKTYAFFVDFSSAFDLVPRNSLFYKLSSMGLSSKIIRILQLSYTNTKTKILYGNCMSGEFNVEVGLKQGCILSPILFALYLNDLNDELPGGVKIDEIHVKILLYADDIVLLSDSQSELQNMIDALYQYCKTWELKVNLEKSKILVFRSGARTANGLRWSFGNEVIEIVNNYKYLGIELNYNLSFKKHLANKLSTAKMAIASTWSNYINNEKISNKNKMKIFVSASRSLLFYGAQIWGFLKYDEVEKLFRYFVKKMLTLPNNTPNYMLHLETGQHSLYLHTLRQHFKYINRALCLPNNRLPRIIAEKIVSKNTYWANEWINISEEIRFIPENTTSPLCKHWLTIMNLLKNKEKNDFITKARNSQFHDLYSELNYGMEPMLTSHLSSRNASLLMKTRGALLDLNARAFKDNTIGLCTLCNFDESENTLHFVGVCPIYKKYRLKFFGKSCLDRNEVIRVLNGDGINVITLCKYIDVCLKYRKLIITEFR